MESIRLPKIESQTVDNGLKIIAVENHHLPLVSAMMMLKKGAEADKDGKGGQADLTLEMLTLGTRKRSSQQIALDVDSLGARLGFYSGWDSSFIELEGLSEDLLSLLEILSDLVLNPTFPRSEFDQLKQRRIAKLFQDQDESDIVADEQFLESIFKGTPYGHPRYGTIDSVGAISIEDLQAFHDRHFVADQSVLMVVGDIDSQAAFQEGTRFFSLLKKSPVGVSPSLEHFEPPPKEGRKVRIINRPDLTQSQIRMGHVGIERNNPDHETFQVANYILGGGGFSSRLMDRVRSQKGYTYGISSSFKGRRSPGPFVISTFTTNETTYAVVQEILKVVDDFIRVGATTRELDESKSYYVGSYPFRFETSRMIAREILEAELYGLGFRSLAEYPQKISKIIEADVLASARRYLSPEAFSIVIMGNADSFKDQMGKVGIVETLDFQTMVAKHRAS